MFVSSMFTSPQCSDFALDIWDAVLDEVHANDKVESGEGLVASAPTSTLIATPTEATTATTPRSSTGSRVGIQQRRPRLKPLSTCEAPASFPRPMTTAMSLRVLNIPKGMHTCLRLSKSYPRASNGRRANKCTVYLRSPDGVRQPVVMISTSGTPHRRFTQGWREFCQHTGVRVGDTVTFRATDVADELDTVITRG